MNCEMSCGGAFYDFSLPGIGMLNISGVGFLPALYWLFGKIISVSTALRFRRMMSLVL